MGRTINLVRFPEGRTVVLAHDADDGCSFCPLHEEDGQQTEYCAALGRELAGDAFTHAPEWCPLRHGQVMIQGGVADTTPEEPGR